MKERKKKKEEAEGKVIRRAADKERPRNEKIRLQQNKQKKKTIAE